jgi:hypothetical protein
MFLHHHRNQRDAEQHFCDREQVSGKPDCVARLHGDGNGRPCALQHGARRNQQHPHQKQKLKAADVPAHQMEP